MLLGIFDGMSGASLWGHLTMVTIFSVFMPLTAISYFRYMLPQKEEEYKKALSDMKSSSKRKVTDTHSKMRYALPVSFVSLICLFAISNITFAGKQDIHDSLLLSGAFFGEENLNMVKQSISVLGFAFLGAFIWSATNIIRRLIANDLSPNVYYSAGIRILLASAVALVLSFILGEEGSNNPLGFKSSLSAIAFLTGMFPERVLKYLIKLFQKFVNPDNLNTDQLSLYRIEGISMQHKERLEEIGIDNAQNLASASLPQLLIDTPYELRLLLDWIGQAKLLCYVKDDIEPLRKIGIRSVFDLFTKDKTPELLASMSEKQGLNPTLLQNISVQVTTDDGIQTLYGFLNGVNTPQKEGFKKESETEETPKADDRITESEKDKIAENS